MAESGCGVVVVADGVEVVNIVLGLGVEDDIGLVDACA